MANILAVRPKPALDFVGDEDDSVVLADLFEDLEIFLRGNDKPSFSQDRFDNEGRHLLGRNIGVEELLQEVGAMKLARGVFKLEGAPIAVGIRHSVNLRGVRCKPELVRFHLTGKAYGQEGSAMEGIFEGDGGPPACCMPGDLDGIFHGLCAAVGKHRLLGKIPRGKAVEPLGQFHVGFVHGDMEAGVDVLINLIVYRGQNFVIAVADVVDPDATCKVDVLLSLHICDQGALRLCSKNWMGIERTLGDVFVSFLQ